MNRESQKPMPAELEGGRMTTTSKTIKVEDIGKNHIRHGAEVLDKDKSGRSLSGQIYVLSLKKWLDDIEQEDDHRGGFT